MMRLLKYDWKRNSNSILGLMAVLLIIQVLITSVGSMNGMEFAVRLTLSMLSYGVVSAILLVIVCRTFDQNIRLYNRRLLPVRTIWSIASSVIQAWISMFILMALVILHLWIFWNMEGFGEIMNLSAVGVSDFILIALSGTWEFTFAILMIFFSITAARTVRKKWGVWLGILLFFVIQYVLQWLEHKFFTIESSLVGQTFAIRFEQGDTVAAIHEESLHIPIGPFVFEMLIAAVIVYAMVYLIDRKVEA